jgi:hypothetical protein
MYKLRADLFQRGTETQFYSDRLAYWIFLIVPAAAASNQLAGLHTRSGQCAAAIMKSWSAVNIVSP